MGFYIILTNEHSNFYVEFLKIEGSFMSVSRNFSRKPLFEGSERTGFEHGLCIFHWTGRVSLYAADLASWISASWTWMSN